MEKIWIERYPPAVPAEINPDRYASLLEMFEESVQHYGDLPAYINMGQTLTYRELELQSRYFAAYLQQVCRLPAAGAGFTKRRSGCADDAQPVAVSYRPVWCAARRLGGGQHQPALYPQRA